MRKKAKTLKKIDITTPSGETAAWIHFMDDGAIRIRLREGEAWSIATHTSGASGTLIRLVPRELGGADDE